MGFANISMPHRHTVRYESETATLEFEVEILSDAILLFKSDPKVLKGKNLKVDVYAQEVEHWLRSKFRNVEVEA